MLTYGSNDLSNLRFSCMDNVGFYEFNPTYALLRF